MASAGTGSTPDHRDNLKLLCWNVDGLHPADLEERTLAVVEKILSKKPDVVLLQEVVEFSLQIFQDKCHGYNVLEGDHTHSYFNAILIRQSTVQMETPSLETVQFETSEMGRHLLIHRIEFQEAKIIVMTSHLESQAVGASERKRQFLKILDYMKEQMDGVNVIFGGDTNLRASEVRAVGGLPSEVLDAWVSCGSALTTRYTWNMAENDNMEWPFQRIPKLRFDRIFVRPANDGKTVHPVSFTLVGKERLSGSGRFASDHWGIWLELSIN